MARVLHRGLMPVRALSGLRSAKADMIPQVSAPARTDAALVQAPDRLRRVRRIARISNDPAFAPGQSPGPPRTQPRVPR